MSHATAPAHDPVDALVLDLLAWIGADGRPYAEAMEAWRTSCPRLPVWEEANLREDSSFKGPFPVTMG